MQALDVKGDQMHIEMGKEYQTRDGRRVRIYAVERAGIYPVHGAYWKDNAWWSAAWKPDGMAAGRAFEKISCFDLVSEYKQPFSYERWVNVYPDGTMGGIYESVREANRQASGNRIACVKVLISGIEGEGI